MSDDESSSQASPLVEKERRSPAEPVPKMNREVDINKNLGGSSKYGLENSGKIDTVQAGDNNKQENHHYGDRFSGSNIINNITNIYNGSSPSDNHIIRKSADSDINKGGFQQNILARKLASDEQKEQGAQTPPSIPQNEEEISRWYSELSSYDQCFVQAMAVFSSAAIPDIFAATNSLYSPVAELVRERTKNMSHPTTSTPLPQKLEAPDGGSLSQRLHRTYVKMEVLSAAKCFVWQDVDKAGISRFQVLFLNFLAHSAYMWPDSIFLEQLEAWAENLEDENSILALIAQGIIWNHYHGALEGAINKWINSDEWYRASRLLYGTYIAEYVEDPANANNPQTSFVLRTIFKWVRKARQKANVYKGQAAALAYMLIGSHTLPLALSGLDSLFELPKGKRMLQLQEAIQGKANDDDDDDSEEDWEFAIAEDTFDGAVNAYCELASTGHTDEILQHLAKQVEKSSHYRILLKEMKYEESYYHRIQRNLTLIAAFTIFFEIARRSLHNLKYRPWVNYDQTRPPTQPATLYNTDGREILLAGLLHGSWYKNIQIFICATLMEKNLGDYHYLALDLLRRWADLVLKDQGPHPDRVRKTYVQFMVEIGRMISSWCRYWKDLGFSPPSAMRAYRNRLEQWQKEGLKKNLPIAALAQEVLAQLPIEEDASF